VFGAVEAAPGVRGWLRGRGYARVFSAFHAHLEGDWHAAERVREAGTEDALPQLSSHVSVYRRQVLAVA
jgi:hypothetical protein